MADGRTPVLTGGCQCGAVRFACYAPPREVGICHCRMCQKASGAPFTSLAEFAIGDVAWTRGTPASFRSSTVAEREFCAKCGTPLTFREIGGATIELATGSFDNPSRVVPTVEVGRESKLPWTDSICKLASKTTLEHSGAGRVARIVSAQHPDHDTAGDWTPPKFET